MKIGSRAGHAGSTARAAKNSGVNSALRAAHVARDCRRRRTGAALRRSALPARVMPEGLLVVGLILERLARARIQSAADPRPRDRSRASAPRIASTSAGENGRSSDSRDSSTPPRASAPAPGAAVGGDAVRCATGRAQRMTVAHPDLRLARKLLQHRLVNPDGARVVRRDSREPRPAGCDSPGCAVPSKAAVRPAPAPLPAAPDGSARRHSCSARHQSPGRARGSARAAPARPRTGAGARPPQPACAAPRHPSDGLADAARSSASARGRAFSTSAAAASIRRGSRVAALM